VKEVFRETFKPFGEKEGDCARGENPAAQGKKLGKKRSLGGPETCLSCARLAQGTGPFPQQTRGGKNSTRRCRMGKKTRPSDQVMECLRPNPMGYHLWLKRGRGKKWCRGQIPGKRTLLAPKGPRLIRCSFKKKKGSPGSAPKIKHAGREFRRKPREL